MSNPSFILLVVSIFAIALATRHLISGFIYGSIPLGTLLADAFPTYNLELFLIACFVFGAAMILRRKANDRHTQTRQ